MHHIRRIADQAAAAYESRDDNFKQLYKQVVEAAGGEEAAKEAFMHACIIRAGIARRNRQDDYVSRLTAAAYAYRPDSVPRSAVRELLVKAGGAGYMPRQPREHPRSSMLPVVMGEG